MPEHLRATYNDIHKLIRVASEKIDSEFKPDLFIAIGGGGFFPARLLRTFLKNHITKKNIPIHAIGLNLYEPIHGTTAEQIGSEVIRTQWLGDAGKLLIGKRVLIVDEVDDTRKTLQYAASELQKDVDVELLTHPESEREALQPKFGVFVVHNKKKPKLGALPADIPYFSAMEISDVWLDYPWEAVDIDEHDSLAEADKAAHQ